MNHEISVRCSAGRRSASADRLDGDAGIHHVLAGGGGRVERHGLVRLLRGGDRGALYREDGTLVCTGDHGPFLRRALALHRKLQHVRARRRVPCRQRSDGVVAGQIFRFRLDVRLCSDRADQRRLSGFVSGRLNERDPCLFPFDHPVSGQRDRGILRHIVHTLFLVGKHQRNSRIQ